ncbi:MAG: homogentisate 1,2-dioxygenase [Candidatus Marinimicrobia bacterium]|nr:homogentisate 1,2-dioxygenase [Candidatus Neomarinimicrobiota bacterium]
MPFYQKQGEIPAKRHVQFRDAKNKLCWEELISREGFGWIYSNIYHKNPPTTVEAVGELQPFSPKKWKDQHRNLHVRTANVQSNGDAISARVPLFYNSDCVIYKAHVDASMSYVYRNGHADELLFVHTGSGILHSNFGDLQLKHGDYVVIPRGIIWNIDILEPMRMLVTESYGSVETPARYRNRAGQLLEHSPFCERDIRTPKLYDNLNDSGSIDILVKLQDGFQTYTYSHHPYDLLGWDGYYFPWIFNINDFEPITGRVHQPPPVHQTFQAPGFVVCSFVPRLYDYHPEAIPAPYAHSNVDSDEILYYVMGNFMSRKGIEEESITYHPMGLPHGPQPGKIEESIGARDTTELAVMIDTFKPLIKCEALKDINDENYPFSWMAS